MGVLKKPLAVVLALISVSLAVHFVAGEIYGLYLAQSDLVWDYLNWPIAFGVIVVLAYHYRMKRAQDRQQHDDNVSFSYLTTNLKLFAAIFLTLWFFANWFEELSMNNETDSAVTGFIWIAFNASFVVLGGATAIQMWNEGPGRDESSAVPAQQLASPLAADDGVPTEGNASTQTNPEAGQTSVADGEKNDIPATS